MRPGWSVQSTKKENKQENEEDVEIVGKRELAKNNVKNNNIAKTQIYTYTYIDVCECASQTQFFCSSSNKQTVHLERRELEGNGKSQQK